MFSALSGTHTSHFFLSTAWATKSSQLPLGPPKYAIHLLGHNLIDLAVSWRSDRPGVLSAVIFPICGSAGSPVSVPELSSHYSPHVASLFMYKSEMIFDLLKLHLFLLSSVILSYFQLSIISFRSRFPSFGRKKKNTSNFTK